MTGWLAVGETSLSVKKLSCDLEVSRVCRGLFNHVEHNGTDALHYVVAVVPARSCRQGRSREDGVGTITLFLIVPKNLRRGEVRDKRSKRVVGFSIPFVSVVLLSPIDNLLKPVILGSSEMLDETYRSPPRRNDRPMPILFAEACDNRPHGRSLILQKREESSPLIIFVIKHRAILSQGTSERRAASCELRTGSRHLRAMYATRPRFEQVRPTFPTPLAA